MDCRERGLQTVHLSEAIDPALVAGGAGVEGVQVPSINVESALSLVQSFLETAFDCMHRWRGKSPLSLQSLQSSGSRASRDQA